MHGEDANEEDVYQKCYTSDEDTYTMVEWDEIEEGVDINHAKVHYLPDI